MGQVGNPIPAGNINLATAGTSSPTNIGVTATMAPVIAEGVKLVQIVLGLTAAAIVILIGVLWYFEGAARTKSNDVFSHALAEAIASRPSNDHNNISLLLAELRRANGDTGWAMSPAESVDATAALKEVVTLYLPTEAQKIDLQACLPILPTDDKNRVTNLTRCLNTLTTLVPAATETAIRVKLLQDIQKQQDDQSAAFRAFWMQAAQMILLNILFPLITALLGYIFGNQQASK